MFIKFKALWALLMSRFQRSSSVPPTLISPKPEHVAVIMDGNGRWANSQGLSRVAGHKRGAEAVKGLIKSCLHHDISHLSIFAFSSENWNRPESEVNALMELLISALENQTPKLDENGVRLNLIGDLSRFNPRIRALAEQSMQATKSNTKLIFNVAINYGGRWDITEATKRVAEKVKEGVLSVDDIDESVISSHLCTVNQPDPDLYIRTSGEYRLSNFMLWQAAYAEFYFTDVLWPDFGEAEFTEALLKFTHRDRRFGNAVDKIATQQHDSKTTRGEHHA